MLSFKVLANKTTAFDIELFVIRLEVSKATSMDIEYIILITDSLVSVIIPKPGKPAYDTPKAFRPIVLLNTLGKLIEKMVARQL